MPFANLNSKNRLHFLLAFIFASLIISVTFFDAGFTKKAEERWLDIAYKIRGESRIDSSIVILYIDADDIKALGGLPLRRSYYALLASAVQNCGAGAVGFDIVFGESTPEYREHDRLFASVAGGMKNAVFSGYFNKMAREESASSGNIPDRFLFDFSPAAAWQSGWDFDLPYSELLEAAPSVGHSHLSSSNGIPLFMSTGGKLLPALSFELARIYLGGSKSETIFRPGEVSANSGNRTLGFPIDDEGNVTVNFSGGIGSLNLVSAFDFLKSYDSDPAGKELFSFAGKIVLVGIISEGRSKFIETPFSDEFPSVGIHAMALNNALGGSFIRHSPIWLNVVIALALTLLAVLLIGSVKEKYGLLFLVLLMILYVSVAWMIFARGNYLLPVVLPVLVLIATGAAVTAYRQQLMRRSLKHLSDERNFLTQEIKNKQTSMEELQKALESGALENASEKSEETLRNIRKYEDEISRLRAVVSDYEPVAPVAEKAPAEKELFEEIVYSGASRMKEVVSFIQKISDTNATVLIMGESGTGKELVAKAIHNTSGRKLRPFIPVNCGALSESLLESELFGHERGAFTGAVKERQGRFELADTGTIFLDEIGDTSEPFQVKLLRVLQDGTFERVGGTAIKKVDVRIIAATNKQLKQRVAEKKFREDLYYRLNVLTMQLPPLRERKEDIPVLVNHFLAGENQKIRCSIGAMNVLKSHIWNGNIRELQSVVTRASLMAKTENRDLIQLRDLPSEISSNSSGSLEIDDQIPALMRAKRFSRNAISETALELGGLSRGTVAEYFRGYCFKVFSESGWDADKTVRAVSGSKEAEYNAKVRNKISDYYKNAVDSVDRSLTLSENIQKARPKYKNLPQRYHSFLNKVIEAYYNGLWSDF